MADSDADHLDSSGGSQSPGQSPFAPGSPFAEYYRPPRLGIIHLLAWTAATAVLLKFWMGMEMIRETGVDPTPQPRNVFEEAMRVIGSTACAAGLVGACILLLAKIRRLPGRLQPGHWLLLIMAVQVLMSLVIWALQTLAVAAGVGGYSATPPILALWSLPEILSAGMYFYAALGSKDGGRWKICFASFAAVNFMRALWYLGVAVFDSLWLWFDFPLGSLIVGVFLLVAVVVDLCGGPRRDWLHWLGVAIVATGVVMAVGWWAWWTYAGRMLV